MKQKYKGVGPIWILFIILGCLAVFAVVVYLFYTGGNWQEYWEKNYPGEMRSAPPGGVESKKNTVDPRIIGTWESDCLVPDLHSKWAEQHRIVINADGTAKHTRWSNDASVKGNCKVNSMELNDDFTYTIPTQGKINFHWISAGGNMYDMYEVTASTILFGHGFRGDHAQWGNKSGGSEGDRFDTLNQFINYKKLQ
ncbi:MAG TPA: hypothetical protein VK255_00185 [Patescibacteria group bacterium]|nr:hypothetical protein [Patescibacteria group bacterium]